ncbi:hypothetical protein BH18CHL2_BH18CHL2_05840 [soil metagenome]
MRDHVPVEAAPEQVTSYPSPHERPLARARVGPQRESLQIALSLALAVIGLVAFRGLGECVGAVMAAGILPFGETYPTATLVCVTERGQLGGAILGVASLVASWWSLLLE